ncbi:hypothetical protein KDA14_05465, partial [Candidatus Saccharibacteria bacterium]|nr:hypothetical protein [Candidatus Saccharibacteria bacterium]
MFDAQRKGDAFHFFITIDDSYVEIFGTTISTGPLTSEVTGYIEIIDSEITASGRSEEFLPVK